MIPYSGDSDLSKDITLLPKTSGNCENDSPLSSPGINKQIIRKQYATFIRYTSIVGTLCDHFAYQTLSHQEAYLISINARTILGLPLTICVSNYTTRRCDLYTSLTATNKFTTQTYLLPPMSKNTNGYDIDVSNLGIKGSPSVNDLRSIQIVPIPYNYLSSIKSVASLSHSMDNSLTSEEINPDTFLTSLPQSSANSTLIEFSHSFEGGWNAYAVSSPNIVSEYLPFLFALPVSHILVNNWENGWQLQSSKKSYLVIIYIPQYLETIGFLCLLGVFLGLIYKKFKKN